MRVHAVMIVVGAVGCTAADAADDATADDSTSEVVTVLASPASWDATGCTGAGGSAWSNRFVPQRGGLTFVDFVAEVGAPGAPRVFPMDAVFGIASGPATTFGQLGAIVRFNSDGFVDARNGGGYAAVTAFAYDTPRSYRVSITADLSTHRYDATVADVATGQSAQIADDYAFRTEQAGMAGFDVIASKVDSAGAVSVCEPAVAPPICSGSSPGASWKERTFPRRTTPFQAEVDLFMFGPGQTDMVVGLAGAQVDGFSGLAAILRLNSSGTFDVRDGGTYRADAAVSYVPDTYRYRAIFAVDPIAKRYSVWIRRSETEPPIRIADGYAFRTEQATLDGLDRIAQYMEPVGEREVQVCDLAVSY